MDLYWIEVFGANLSGDLQAITEKKYADEEQVWKDARRVAEESGGSVFVANASVDLGEVDADLEVPVLGRKREA